MAALGPWFGGDLLADSASTKNVGPPPQPATVWGVKPARYGLEKPYFNVDDMSGMTQRSQTDTLRVTQIGGSAPANLLWPGEPATIVVYTPGMWANISPKGAGGGSSVNVNDKFGCNDIRIDPSSPSTLYTCWDEQGLHKSTNGGETWQRIGPFDSPLHVRVNPTNSNHLYVVQGVRGDTMGFWVSTDGGANWTRPAGFTNLANGIGVNGGDNRKWDYDLYDLAVDTTDFNHVLISWHTGWNGYEWSGSDHNVFVGDNWGAGVFETFDGGSSWTKINPAAGMRGVGNSIQMLYNPAKNQGMDRKTWLLGTQQSGLWRTTNGGSSWTQVSTIDMTHGGMQIHMTSDGTLYTGGSQGVMVSTDNGATWSVRNGGNGLDTIKGYFTVLSDGTRFYAQPGVWRGDAPSGVKWYTSTDGTSWSAFNDQTFNGGAYNGVYDAANGILYSANWGTGAWRLKVTSGGNNPPPPPVATAPAISSQPANARVTAGQTATLAASAQPVQNPPPTTGGVTGTIDITSVPAVWYQHDQNLGKGWVEVSTPLLNKVKELNGPGSESGDMSATSLTIAPNGDLLMSSNRGLFRSRDGGGTWSPIDGATKDSRASRNTGYPETSGSILLDPEDSRRVAYLWFRGNSFYTDGSNWFRPKGPGTEYPGFDCASIDWTSATPQIFLGPRHGGGPLDITRDGGNTWDSQANKLNATGDAGPGSSDSMVCVVDSQTMLYNQGNDELASRGRAKALFPSTDQGRTWNKVAEGQQSVSKHAVALRNGTVYFYADRNLWISRDKGATWTTRPIPKISAQPPQLFGDWTGGKIGGMLGKSHEGVIYSKDEGQSWTVLIEGANFPPKYQGTLYRARESGYIYNTDACDYQYGAGIWAFDPSRNVIYASTSAGPVISKQLPGAAPGPAPAGGGTVD